MFILQIQFLFFSTILEWFKSNISRGLELHVNEMLRTSPLAYIHLFFVEHVCFQLTAFFLLTPFSIWNSSILEENHHKSTELCKFIQQKQGHQWVLKALKIILPK